MAGSLSLRRYTSRSGVVFYVAREHTPTEGPANGGLRMLPYHNEIELMADAVRLSHRMTQKHAIYRTGFSGAKITACADPSEVDREDLLTAVAGVLNSEGGRLFTGCDMNVGNEDMRLLATMSPYVLAAVNSQVDASTATAHGIVASVREALGGIVGGRSFLVHGVGNTGGVVASLLIAEGGDVRTFDLDPGRARAVAGGTALPEGAEWWSEDVDALVLCSASGVLTPELAARLRCRVVVSGANCPYHDNQVEEVLAAKGVLVVPDVVTNAGAVICDSIEHYHPELFHECDPSAVYDFVATTVAERTRDHLKIAAANDGRPMVGLMVVDGPLTVCGARFATSTAVNR